MLRGAIFDLGDTLIYHEYEGDWEHLRARMLSDLMDYLQEQARLDFEREAFETTFRTAFSAFDKQRQTHFIEHTSEQILLATYEHLNLARPTRAVIEAALVAFFAYSETLWRPMPDVHNVLRNLADSGLKLGLVSNASDDANVQRLIDTHDLRVYFDPIIVSAAAGIRKPNPRIFAPIFEQWQLPPEELVMVGDTLGADVLGALNAGMKSVWLKTRAERPDNLEHRQHLHPDASADTLADVPQAIHRLNGAA